MPVSILFTFNIYDVNVILNVSCTPTDGASPKTELGDATSPRDDPASGIQEPVQGEINDRRSSNIVMKTLVWTFKLQNFLHRAHSYKNLVQSPVAYW